MLPLCQQPNMPKDGFIFFFQGEEKKANRGPNWEVSDESK